MAGVSRVPIVGSLMIGFGSIFDWVVDFRFLSFLCTLRCFVILDILGLWAPHVLHTKTWLGRPVVWLRKYRLL